MAPSKLRKAIGAVKDRTSISLAKVTHSNYSADLDVAILKATRHEEYPADERYIREITAMTLCSRSHVSSCVNAVSKRLNKTNNWTVALKTLMLIQRLLSEGDPSYEQEMFYATRRGTRLLNMSDFRDGTKSGSWDFSAYVRTYALYLDEQLEFRMHDRRRRHGLLGEDDEEEFIMRKRSSPVPTTPVRDMKIYHVFTRAQHLQQLLERFLACRPTGPAKTNRVVLASLYPIVKESFQIYSDATGVMNILIERFMDLEVRDCMKVIDIFNRMSKQFDELEAFYRWCKVTGLARSSEYPEVDRIEQKKLDMMDEVVRDKMALAQGKRVNKNIGLKTEGKSIEDKVPRATNGIRASPPPKEYPEEKKEETKQDGIEKQNSTKEETHKLDPRDNEVKNEEQTNKLALALIDISTPRTTENATPEWVAFTSEDTQNWETSFVHSSSTSDNQQAKPGGGFNGLPLEAVYQQSNSMTLREAWGATGSASSVALGSTGKQQAMLALPAPPVSGTGVPLGASDPFSASWSVSPPAYVQMSEIEQKQRMLVDEQLLWQQYARDGSRGHMGVQQYQNGMGAYSRMY